MSIQTNIFTGDTKYVPRTWKKPLPSKELRLKKAEANLLRRMNK